MEKIPTNGKSGELERELPRILGLWDIVGIVVGGVVGSGIFIVPATVAAGVRSPLLIFAVWVFGGLLSFFGALTFAELGAAYPKAGGMYCYLRESYGSLVAFLFGWTVFLVIDSGAVATLAVGISTKYLPQLFALTNLEAKLISAVFIIVLVAVNYVGVRWGANLQNFLTVLKFAALVGVCVVVFLFADGKTAQWVSPAPETFSWGLLGSFGLALVAVFWAYKGWESATYSAGETKRPERNLPLGMFIGLGAVIIIYIIANMAYLYVFPAGQMAGSDRIASEAMNSAVGPLGATIIAVIILFSMAGAANQVILTSPRVYFAMARDRLFFKKIAEVHPKFLTPHFAILAIGAWSLILSLTGTFEQLFTYVIFGQWIFFGLCAGSVFILRKKRPDLPRPYKTFGYPVTPIIFILAAALISINTLINEIWNALAGLLIIAVGVPAYYYWKRKSRS